MEPMGYLRLMKSIWIMDQIRDSEDWKKIQRTSPGNLYDRCVREMDRVSFASQQTRQPTHRFHNAETSSRM